ncbi:MAG: aminoacyl-histidine dipeptidase [Clostridia bacterium]|nr:aminoacyl-histidine dipeptidase [Clostridia bacterium]
MSVLENLQPERVFYYFEKLCAIPHGSGNMEKISEFCLDFAKAHSLCAVRDSANNVIIFKGASEGYENAEPVILQGHLDMVCQKRADCNIDFEKDGLSLYIDGDFVKAHGTTLGADNGIAVAMTLAILESKDISHPPIEAVFTTDEEVGMDGALALDMSLLSGNKLINLDSEDEDILTVSCAGGSDFSITAPLCRKKASGTPVTVTLGGLRGGHSGIEIASGRVNSNILTGRLLNTLQSEIDFEIVSVCGGDKGNAIPLLSSLTVLTEDADGFINKVKLCLETVKKEISAREPGFEFETAAGEYGVYDVIGIKKELIFLLSCAPNGVLKMSAEIEGLVETSLNLGIVSTDKESLYMLFTLRSNKRSALAYLEKKLTALCTFIDCEIKTGGHYPPWEFKENSELQELYKEVYRDLYGKEPRVEAIHAGLECGVLSSGKDGLDCISIGPELYDVHTVSERLSIPSTERIYKLVLEILKRCN